MCAQTAVGKRKEFRHQILNHRFCLCLKLCFIIMAGDTHGYTVNFSKSFLRRSSRVLSCPRGTCLYMFITFLFKKEIPSIRLVEFCTDNTLR